MPQSKEANGIVSIAHQTDKQHIPCQQTKHVETLLSLTQDEATHELANQEIVDRPDTLTLTTSYATASKWHAETS